MYTTVTIVFIRSCIQAKYPSCSLSCSPESLLGSMYGRHGATADRHERTFSIILGLRLKGSSLACIERTALADGFCLCYVQVIQRMSNGAMMVPVLLQGRNEL